MKKKNIYERDYSEEKLAKYYKLVENIRKNSLKNIKYLASKPYETNYIFFDGNVLSRLTLEDLSRENEYSNYKSKITVKEVGCGPKIKSKIEILLLAEGFKKIEV